MKYFGQHNVQHINRSYRRRGTLWKGQFRSCLTQSEIYVLGCYRYIKLNPVRAGMVLHPRDDPWSSYRINAEGKASNLIQPHGLYQRLAQDAAERRVAYRAFFRSDLDP